ncbi:zinc finger, SWIM-type containing protein [Tanacetum coccineum]
MTTSSTSSLLPANSPTTNLPPATSTTSHLLLATSTTSNLPPATSSTSHLLSSTSTVVRSVVRNPEDGSVECTCRHFLRYGFLCRHVFCVLKNCNIEVIPERYILRRWRRDLIPPALRRNTNRYREKDKAIKKLTNEANFIVDECLFLLRKDEEQLKQFVEKLENIKKEIQVKVPNPPSQKTGDVIEYIYAIKKPKQNLVNNPQKASNKGGRRGERRKSGREIAMKVKAKRARKCG